MPARPVDALTPLRAQLELILAHVDALPDAAFEEPVRLPGWNVRHLVAHLDTSLALLLTAAAGPAPDRATVTTATYYDGIGEVADMIRDRERDRAATETPPQLRAALHATAAAVLETAAALPPDRVLAVRAGDVTTADFLVTRLVETVVHGLDLGVRPDRGALREVVRLLVAMLAARAPGRTVEVRVPPFAAVQCIAGPRHTRGTPPNVVEAEPVTFVEVATGRLPWAAAVADGRIRASGERADLTPLLPLL